MKLPVKYSEILPNEKWIIREAYIEKQSGKCYFCGGSLGDGPPQNVLKNRIHKHLYPKGFFNNPIHLHHSHESDLTIGAVHAYCNAILWEYYGE